MTCFIQNLTNNILKMTNHALKEAAQEKDRRNFAHDCVKMANSIENIFSESVALLLDWQNNDYAPGITEYDLRVYRFSLEDLHKFITSQLQHEIASKNVSNKRQQFFHQPGLIHWRHA